MRLIDADEVIFELNRMLNIVDERNARPDQEEEFKTIRTYVEWTKEVIHDTPTIDAVEVVRCKGCKWWSEVDEDNGKKFGECKNPSYVISDTVFLNEDWYCADGERREE